MSEASSEGSESVDEVPRAAGGLALRRASAPGHLHDAAKDPRAPYSPEYECPGA